MAYDDISLQINHNDLSDLSLKVMDYAENIYTTLSKLNAKMESLKDCYDCASYQVMKQQYDSIKKNFSIIKKNIISYSDDFIALIQKTKEGEKKIVKIIHESTMDVNMRSNQVEKL